MVHSSANVRIRLDYGTDGLDVDLPDERITVIEPMARPAVPDPRATLLQAIRSPLERARLRDIVRAGQKIAISVCDITRAQPRIETLQALFEEMPQVNPDDVTILIATGTHRGQHRSGARAHARPGDPELATRSSITTAATPSTLARAGTTSTGVQVYLNRRWLEADVRITTGFVEPHFFAGFSGGPKMVAPGLAGLETVMTLHDARHIGHPRATWGITEGNPIHDDVREIARMVTVHFASTSRSIASRRSRPPSRVTSSPSTAPPARTPRTPRCVRCRRRSTWS